MAADLTRSGLGFVITWSFGVVVSFGFGLQSVSLIFIHAHDECCTCENIILYTVPHRTDKKEPFIDNLRTPDANKKAIKKIAVSNHRAPKHQTP